MADKETVIGPETRISGEVRGDEDLLVRGRIEGKIQLSQTLTVDEGGIVQADVDVRILIVSGVVVGSIRASESVRLTDKARVVGDISAPRFTMEAGAAYRGRVDMGEVEGVRPAQRRASTEKPAARPAPPRMATPARAAAPSSAIRAPSPPSAPPRVSSAPPRPSAPPSLPRPEAASSASAAPAWAKKKLRRR
jgi:cytoskeletal protein CcmA (bactofilin family)